MFLEEIKAFFCELAAQLSEKYRCKCSVEH